MTDHRLEGDTCSCGIVFSGDTEKIQQLHDFHVQEMSDRAHRRGR